VKDCYYVPMQSQVDPASTGLLYLTIRLFATF